MPTAKQLTQEEMRAAIKALGITLPIRCAFWKGTQIILRCRDGDHAWTPPGAKKPAPKKVTA